MASDKGPNEHSPAYAEQAARQTMDAAHGTLATYFGWLRKMQSASPWELGVTLTRFGFRPDDDLAAKFRQMEQSDMEGLIVIAGALTYVKGKEIAELTLAYRLPSCHAFYETVRAGGLVSLGPDIPAMAQQGAVYIDKIIHGAKPADLPVQQPAKYELTINLKTAKAFGLTVPQSLLAGADEVIE
jgi:putative tryptophan/tyrosine transport system substrate-binding protein